MSKKITIFHIEDDLRYVNKTRKILEKIEGLEYLGFSLNPEEGVLLVKERKPNILLLDIEMMPKDGIWVADALKDEKIAIVFLTTHTEFAIKAFECFALHYILKPLSIKDLTEILQRYKINNPLSVENQKEQISDLVNVFGSNGFYPKRIFVNTQKQILILQMDEIVYISAEGSYTNFHMHDNRVIVSGKNMKSYSTLVEKNPDFIKIHRSYIINQSHLLAINKKKIDLTFLFKDGQKIQMSTFRRSDWMNKFYTPEK